MTKSLLFFLTVTLETSHAITVNPSMAQIDPNSSNRSAVFQVANKSKKSVSVQVFAVNKIVDDFGVEKNTPLKEKEFMAYPSELKIKPESVGSFRILYIGKKELEKEKAFRLVFTEIPEEEAPKKKKANRVNLKILTSMTINLYVTPKTAETKMSIKNIREKDVAYVEIKNSGTKRLNLKGKKLTLHSGEKSTAIDVKRLFDLPIPAGSRRLVEIPGEFITKNKDPLNISIDD